MNKALNILFYVLCIIAGLAGYFADTYLNLEHVGIENTGPAITIVVIAICSAISLTVASMAFKVGKYAIATLCSIGFLTAVIWSAPVSLSRISASIDAKQTKKDSHLEKRKLLQQALNDVKEMRLKESKKGGCGKNCQKLVDKEQQIMMDLANLGLPQDENGASKRIAYAIPFIDAKTVEMIVPISAVIALTCLMNGLLTLGISSLLEMIKKPNQTEQKTVQSVLKENVVKKDNIMNGEEILPSRDKKDPIVKMVERLGEISLSDIAEKMEKSPPYVSTYVSDLERRGLIKKNRRGRRVFLSLP
jgi:hypothetical protein